MSNDRLYNLLPAIYRIRDNDAGEPLRALLAVLEGELEVLETDIGDLYNQWFIETCAEWVVPYIGDLLDVRELYVENARQSTFGRQERRAFVANTLAYRRRKGTTPVLEQLTRDLTGWSARVVEVTDRLTTTAHLDHPRPQSGWVDLRQSNRTDPIGTPFERLASYTPEILRVQGARGRYNRRQINLFLWRLVSYPIDRSTPRLVLLPTQRTDLSSPSPPRFYTFDPIGNSIPLFNQPQPETEITRLAEEINVPGKLRRSALSDELQSRASDSAQGQPLGQVVGYPSYFNELNPPVVQVFINGQSRSIPSDEILIAPLESWQLPQNLESTFSSAFPSKVVAIDPEQGRLAFLDENPPSRVEVSYAYGFSGDVGSGPYEHQDLSEAGGLLDQIPSSSNSLLTWDIEQENSADANPLATAIDQWNRLVQGWEGLRQKTLVPIMQVVLPASRMTSVTVEPGQPLRPAMQFGILKGLTVDATVDATDITIAPGVAVDGQGRVLTIELPETVNLTQYEDPQVTAPTIRVGIILAYRAASTAPHYQLHLLPEAALSTYTPGSFVLLTVVTINTHTKQIQNLDLSDRPSFSPGLVSGFTVVLNPGNESVKSPPGIRRDRNVPLLSAVITAGWAVDSRGRAIAMIENAAIDLRKYQGQRVWLVIAWQKRLGQPDWKIIVVPTAEIEKFPTAIYLPLAYLEIPTGEILTLNTAEPRVTSGIAFGLTVTATVGESVVTIAPGTAIDAQTNVLQSDIHHRINLRRHAGQTVLLVMFAANTSLPPHWLIEALAPDDPKVVTGVALAQMTISPWGRVAKRPDLSMRRSCKPGIVRGLTTTRINAAQVEITAGIALTRDRLITLERPCQLDLSHQSGTLTLFIGDPKGSGLSQLQILSPKFGKGWNHIGIVPEEPENATTGTITVRDHRTYVGNLTVIIPTLRQLWLRSAGTRPHLLGDLTVRGLESSRTESQALPGALILDGWLLEGQLTVAAGYLKRLQILHSTLIPDKGGLVVEHPIAPQLVYENDLTNWSIALVLYWVNQIQRLVGLGFDVSKRSPQENLVELLDLAKQQVVQVVTTAQELFQSEEAAIADPKCIDPCQQPNCFEDDPVSPATPPTNNQLTITLYRSICGAIQLPDSVPHLSITDSIVDRIDPIVDRLGSMLDKTTPNSQTDSATPLDGAAIIAPGSEVNISTTTVFGSTLASSLEASNSIFTSKVMTERRQIGCLRFCYLPENSHTPRRYRCQPDLALSETLDRLPAPITALAIVPPSGELFAGTSGNGIFIWLPTYNPTDNPTDPASPDQLTWSSLKSTATWHITTLAVLTWNGQPALYAGISGGEVYRSIDRGQTWENLKTEAIHTEVVAFAVYDLPDLPSNPTVTHPVLLLATGGDGIVLGSGSLLPNWTDFNTGLTYRNLTGLAVSTQGRVFVSTAGGGVFRLLQSNPQSTQQSPYYWEEVNGGLQDLDITVLTIDTLGRLFVGTNSGQIWRSTDHGVLWTLCYSGSIGMAITSLLTYPKVGPDHHELLAGTANGKILRSIDNGQHWTQVYRDLTQTDITALVINSMSDPIEVIAGTTVGNVLVNTSMNTLTNQEDRWQSRNEGLINVDEKLLILDRLQPQFTARRSSDPGYAQLSLTSAIELRSGAKDGSEIGTFNYLQQPQREAALRASLEEYLPVGLELGIFYIT